MTRWAIALLAAALSAQEGRFCAIDGTALDAVTGAPVNSVKVSLIPVTDSSSPLMSPADRAPFTGFTDAEGKYSLPNVWPGKYRLRFDHLEYSPMEHGARRPNQPGATITLAATDTKSGLDVKMTPHGGISGRIVNEDGEPMQAAVRVYRWAPDAGNISFARSISTESNGDYKLRLAPGRYLVLAQPMLAAPIRTPKDPPTSEEEKWYLPAYYPNGFDASTAAPIEIGPGVELRLDMKMEKTRAARLSGKVIVDPGVPDPGEPVVLLYQEGAPQMEPLSTRARGPGRIFEFRVVAPGRYWILASLPRGMIAGEKEAISVGTRSVDGIELRIHPPKRLEGVLRVEGAEEIKFESLTVTLRPTGVFSTTGHLRNTVGKDGGFLLSTIGSEHYSIDVQALPEGYYVKSATMGPADVLQSGLDLTQGVAGRLDVVISGKAGSVSGSVIDDERRPLPAAEVALVPADPALRLTPRLMRKAVADSQGRFAVKNVPPGDYRVCAWGRPPAGISSDADFLSLVDSKCSKLTLDPSGAYNIQVTVLTE